MANRKLITLSLAFSGLFTLCFTGARTGFVPTNAADSTWEKLSNYSTASLPVNIDLNPVSEPDVRSYYSALNGRNLSGNELLKALNPILSNGQKYYKYDGSRAVWQMYEITDRDWTLSPVTGITNGTYDAANNIIRNYSYGTASTPKDNPYIHVLYRNPGVEAGRLHAWDHHGDNNGIDREHVWPKSRGFGKDSSSVEHKDAGARGDIHHLLPGDSYVNSVTHSNYSYGFVDLTKPYDDAGNEYKIDDTIVVAGNYLGTSATFGTSIGNEKVFEPQDCDKGDIARACFYMVARYNNLAGDDETIDAGNPNLFLSDSSISTATVMSDKDNPVSIGILRDLLAWHRLDPVDDFEIYRNDLIHRNFGKNRNPFIDFPEWVDYIWGTVTIDENNSRHITSYSSTPSGQASPLNDVLNGYKDPEAPEQSSSPSSLSSTSTEEEISKDTIEVEAGVWRKTDFIAIGDTVAIVAETADGKDPNTSEIKPFPAVLSGLAKNKYGEAAREDVSNYCGTNVIISDEALPFTAEAGATEGTLSLRNGEGYLYYRRNKDKNQLALTSVKDASSSWVISFQDGNAVLLCSQVYDNKDYYLRWNNSSNNGFRFNGYNTMSGMREIQLYKFSPCSAEADIWGQIFLDNTAGCNINGGYDNENMHWDVCKSAYEQLDESTKLYLQNQEGNETVAGQAIERYDYIVTKYGVGVFEDFIGRSPEPQSSIQVKVFEENRDLVSVVALIIVFGVGAAFATIIFSKRTKREN